MRPRAIAYFCSALPDAQLNGAPTNQSDGVARDSAAQNGAWPDCAARQREQVRRNAIDFLNRDIAHLWPGASRPGGGFRWELLMGADEAGTARALREHRAVADPPLKAERDRCCLVATAKGEADDVALDRAGDGTVELGRALMAGQRRAALLEVEPVRARAMQQIDLQFPSAR